MVAEKNFEEDERMFGGRRYLISVSRQRLIKYIAADSTHLKEKRQKAVGQRYDKIIVNVSDC